ncbi:hypothetical protein ACXHXM_02085
MARKKQRTTWKLSVSLEQLERIAPIVLDGMEKVAEGYRLTNGSGLWRKRDGSLTARFVYRSAEDETRSMVMTVRNIILQKGLREDAHG